MAKWRPAILVMVFLALLASPGPLAQTGSTLSAAEILALTEDDRNEEAAVAARALLEAERALDIRKELGHGGIELAWSYYVVGLVHNLGWDGGQALEPFRHALQLAEAHYGEGHPATADYVREYGTALFGVDNHRDALVVFEKHREIVVAKHGDMSVKTLDAYYNLALTHQLLGHLEVSDRHLEAAERILEQQDPAETARKLIWVRNLRTTMMVAQGCCRRSSTRCPTPKRCPPRWGCCASCLGGCPVQRRRWRGWLAKGSGP